MSVKDWKRESGDSFENHARNLLQPIYPWLLQDLRNAFSKSFVNLDILEIGCGPGFMNEHFQKAGFSKIIEIDLSLAMLEKARLRVNRQNSLLVQGDAMALPLADSCFDLVFSRGSLFFWRDLGKSLREIFRVLKPGGMALIGGGYGLSTPEELLLPIREHAKNSGNKSSIPRIDLEQLKEMASKIFSENEILQASKRGFWLKSQK